VTLPKPLQRLDENMADVRRLMEIHQEEAGTTRGRKYDVEVLNKSGVVLAYACWEAFVEDCATDAFDHLIANVPGPDSLPQGVQKLVAKRLKEDKNDLSVWRLAGERWRTEMTSYRDDVLRKYVGPLNTPNSKNVDDLYRDLIGLENLSANWKWHKMPASDLTRRLKEFISLRGDIAHRNDSHRTVLKFDVLSNADIIARVAAITSNRVRDYLNTTTGTFPWSAATEPPKPGPRGPSVESTQ
jgi:hypothetical protein